MADKDLSSYSRYPTLGVDTILPQFRAKADGSAPSIPTQEEFPVWYFFYGTLADPETLARVLDITIDPQQLVPAVIHGGKLDTWAGKYRALMQSTSNAKVQGHAFLVKNKEQEDALRFWETDMYQVVRCKIETEGVDAEAAWIIRDGLTFLFVGT